MASLQKKIMKAKNLEKAPNGVLYGKERGYYITLNVIDSRTAQLFVGGVNDRENAAEIRDEFIASLRQRYSQILRCSYDNGFTAYLSVQSAEDLERLYNGIVYDITEFYYNNGYVNGCFACGRATEDVSVAATRTSTRIVCPECKAKMNATPEKPKGNMGKGLVGALGGAIIGTVIWALIAELGYVSVIGGMAMALLTIGGYRLFAKGMSPAGMTLCVIIMIAGIFIGSTVPYVNMYYEYYHDLYDVTYFEVAGQIFELLSDTQNMSYFVETLIKGYAFAFVGIICYVRASKK